VIDFERNDKMFCHHYVYPCHYYVNDLAYRYQPYFSQGFHPLTEAGNTINNDRKGLAHQENRDALQDYGKQPFVINIEEATVRDNRFRTALWTGNYLQVTLMNINVGEDIGLEIHPTTDQFLRIEDGQGVVQMGNTKNNLTFRRNIQEDSAIMIPAGTWHNVTNTGNRPLKLYSIYAPPHHPFGTLEQTKADAMAAEQHH